MSFLRRWVDPFIVLLIASMLIGVFFPVSGQAAHVYNNVTTFAVALLFFVYGMRISTREAWEGLKNWRLQSTILAATFVMFPVYGLILRPLVTPIIGADLASGLLYLCLLPSTVQSSVAFTSIARGNVAAAICAASLSNVAGMILTPAFVAVFMQTSGVHLTANSVLSIFYQLLLPFIIGQLLQPKVGGWVRRQQWMAKITDRGTILLVVYGAFSEGMSEHIWTGVTVGTILVLIVICGALLAAALGTTMLAGRRFGFPRGDRIALLMCGSKKSLATGVPMARVIFSSVPGLAATVVLPVMVFHQIQLFVCALIARRMGAAADQDAPQGPPATPAG